MHFHVGIREHLYWTHNFWCCLCHLAGKVWFYLTLNVTESNVYTSNFSESPAHLTAEAVHLCCQNMNNLQLNITPSRLLILKHSVGVQPET